MAKTPEHSGTEPIPHHEVSPIPTLTAVKNVLNGFWLHSQMCYEAAVNISCILLEKLDGTRYQVKIMQMIGHAVVVVDDVATHTTVIVNVGYPPNTLTEDYYVLQTGENHPVFRNPKYLQIESVPLKTPEAARAAFAFGWGMAQLNSQYPK